MKKTLCFRVVWIAALCGMVLVSSCKKNKLLKLQGVWEQESYWIPNDTIAADTLIRTYTISTYDFGCNGDFKLKRTVHHPYYHEDPALGNLDSIYIEYVAGTYTTSGKTITLDGKFYLPGYITPADSANPDYHYSYGPFNLEASFKLDSERLIIEGTTDKNHTTQIFKQLSAHQCF